MCCNVSSAMSSNTLGVLGPTSTVRLCNWLINKEKSRFEAGCGAKWRICANLPVYNRLNWLGFSLLMGLLAPQQPQVSDFLSNFSELLNRTVEVGPEAGLARVSGGACSLATGYRTAMSLRATGGGEWWSVSPSGCSSILAPG